MPSDFEPENVSSDDNAASPASEQASKPVQEETTRPLPAYFFSVALDNTLKVCASV